MFFLFILFKDEYSKENDACQQSRGNLQGIRCRQLKLSLIQGGVELSECLPSEVRIGDQSN